MALETTDNRKEYAGNGATTGFSFPYYFLAEADLTVISRNDTTGVESTKVLTTDYTVAGEGNEAGGTVTMLVAPPTGTTLVIFRDPAITQGTDFRENDSLPAESTEEAFDRAAMVSQRLSERADRTVRLSDGFSPAFDPVLPSDLDDSGDKIPLINAAGDGWAPAADWPSITGVTAGMAAALLAAEAARDAAQTAQGGAETAEANAETAESNAETAETAAELAESNAAASAAAAAASAAAAAATLASAFFRDVVFFTSANSPVAVDSTHNGKLLVFDSSGGAIAVALPQISGLTLPFNLTALCSLAGNNITFTRGGTDVFTGGGSTKVLSVANTGFQIAADTDPSPDTWSVLDFGTVGDGTVTAAKLATSAITGQTADTTPANDDLLLTSDTSASAALKKVTVAQLVTAVGATQAEQETASAVNRVVTPGRQQFHPSAAKAWFCVTYAAGVPTLDQGYNISSIVDNGVGTLFVNFTTAFSNSNYAPNAATQKSATNNSSEVSVIINTTSQIDIQMYENNVATDPTRVYGQAFGDQ